MGEIGWGIIGCGDVTEVKSGPGFQQASGSRLVAVMRRDHRFAAARIAAHRVDGYRVVHRHQSGIHERPQQRHRARRIAARV